ncbi:sugar kinase [Halococcus salifodinae]|uniref:PfkB domain-containing protein n=1 Tax=Halococcus salifodinae DSM 8989 TaxID=1227456 RepID=M0N6Z0_9EURY|nr:PfkB family carbohydrate kinase [Halococcus salifodinae]EMA53697.1 PfkB domain-containing protein [Halococcus salifodinae DSM 8989]
MSPRVVTLGETMVLINPAESGPMKYTTEFKKSLGGAESNVAIGLARLGHDVGWISKLGADPHGEYLRSFVRGEGVDTSHVTTTPDAPTGIMFKERRALGESSVYYYRHGSAASTMTPADLPEAFLTDAEYLHLTGITPALSDSCRETVFAAVERAREADVTISFDPNLREKLWDSTEEMRSTLLDLVGAADIVLPGIEEGRTLFDADDPEAIAAACLDRGADLAAVKLGAAGALVADHATTERVAGYDVERVVDPVGAGDGFAAGFLAGRLRGLDPVEATERANAIGAFATTVAGDIEGLPTSEELEVFRGERDAVYR